MDINSLLSPAESPAPDSGSPVAGSPVKLHTHFPAPTSVPASRTSPTSQPAQWRPMSSPTEADVPHRMHRTPSTSGIDTLADLASMQHHQHTVRTNHAARRSIDAHEPSPAPTATPTKVRPSLQAIARTHSGSRSSLDIRMADAPAQTPPPRALVAPSLSESQRQRVAQLSAVLSDNADTYEAHVELIRILYQGLTAHIFPTSSTVHENEALSYDALGELRQTLESMSSRFALGEELWTIKLHMLQLTATSPDDCVALMEAFEKAVAECPASTTLWAMYAEWFLSLYSGVHPQDTPVVQLSKPHDMPLSLSDEDQIILAEVFAGAQMMDVWKRGADETIYRIDTSYQVWDKWIDLQLARLQQSGTPDGIQHLRTLLMTRLATPHSTWEDTFQKFSTFVSTYEQDSNYEDTMVAVSRQGAGAKKVYRDRESFEFRLRRAAEIGDKATEWAVFGEYTEWELARSRQNGQFNYDLTNALFLRLLLRFPSDFNGWEDYLTFLGEEANPHTRVGSQLAVLDRACKHCPWSGALWSQYIQAAELANLGFADIGQIKHKATSTGLLDHGSMEEVLKIQTAMCGYLRRDAFRQESQDEELDIAEMGIRSAIEDTETLGRGKYGDDYHGDPQYRLERIYIKFLMQSRNYSGARQMWEKLVSRHGNSYEFWLRYYAWEMLLWATMLNPLAETAARQTPSIATEVLRRAIERPSLDWPEKVIETYLSHCEDHEGVDELQTAILQCRKAAKRVNKRRELEAHQAGEQAQPSVEAAPAKRKHEGDALEASRKKTKADEAPAEAKPQVKRDRENATVLVRNLPSHATEKHVRHFFHECGPIKSIQLLPKDGVMTATIEFESKEDAFTAQTKDQKLYEHNTITVQIGTGTTLYVTNFPPTGDEAYIRDLFRKHGDIVEVRFPSLKYDTHRRFCYVQFSTAEAAQAATALDGARVGDDLSLVAKISDPSHRQARQGALHEGREVYAANIDWAASEADIKELFRGYGTVERVRIPRRIDGKSKGTAFIVFSTKDEATAALALNETVFRSRPLTVALATSNANKRQATLAGSASPPPPPPPPPGGTAATSTTANDPPSARTVALLDVPDTVNAARIQALAAPHGPLIRVILRPDRAGALLEYATVPAAGAAALALEGTTIDGSSIRVGTPADLHASRPTKTHPPGATAAASAPPPSHIPGATAGFNPLPPSIRRGLGAARGGSRRGGLGIKRGPASGSGSGSGSSGAAGAVRHETAAPNGDAAGAPASNADFKALFLRGKEGAAKEAEKT